MYRRNNTFLGAVFVGLGILFLLSNMNILHLNYDIFNIGFLISRLWPLLFLIIPGLAFHYGFLTGKSRDAGLLVPGGILLVTGITCQLSYTFNVWHIMWPGFILAVSVGLFELYMFGSREKGLLIPVSILGGLSLIFFSMTLSWWFDYSFKRYMVPVLLIIIGLVLLFKNRPFRGSFK
jgi:hypothetical protein